MKPLKTKCLFLVLLLLSGLLMIRFYYYLTDDFRLGNIIHPFQWEQERAPLTAEEHAKLTRILNQKFHYIGKGAQVYAFASADEKWVIKFFKFKHLKPSLFIALLPPVGPLKEFKLKNEQRKKRKLEGVFKGHAIAFEHDAEYSGMEYIHLNPTKDLNLSVQLIDKLGLERELDLDPIVFVIQKKGDTLRAVLSKLLKSGNIELACQRASQILDMYVAEYQRGVWDRDHGISHNTGFIGNQPFHLDVGKFSYDAKLQTAEFYKSDLKHVAAKMESWVKEHYPEQYDPFYQTLDRHLQTLLPRLSVPAALSSMPSAAASKPQTVL